MIATNVPIEIVPESFTPFWQLGQSNSEYHADKTAVSSTGLKKILKSPRTFYSYLTEPPEDETEKPAELRFGTLFHTALLEPDLFKKLLVVCPKFSGTGSKKEKEEWVKAQSKDALIMSQDEVDQIYGMVESVDRHSEAPTFIRESKPEVSGYFRDPATGIKCRIRPDLWSASMGTLIDVKTTVDCSQDAFSRSIWAFRYDFQVFFYSLGIQMIEGRSPEEKLFLAVEKKKPYECALWRCDELILNKGMETYSKAIEKLYKCLTSNQWESYQQCNQTISLPGWALSL